MKPTATHAAEDRLLEYAYGELSPAEAAAVEGHLQGCVKCAGELDSIRGVRRAMGPLAEESAPEAGLESLLAYAEQTARRTREERRAQRPAWRRWVYVLATASALGVLMLVSQDALQTHQAAPLAGATQSQDMRQERAEAPVQVAERPAPVAQAAPPPAPAPLEGLAGSGALAAADGEAARPLPSRRKAEAAAELLRKGDMDARADWTQEAPSKAAPGKAAAGKAAAGKAAAGKAAPPKVAALEKKAKRGGASLYEGMGNAMDGAPVVAPAPAAPPPAAPAAEAEALAAEAEVRSLSLRTSKARSRAPGSAGRAESAGAEKYAELARMHAARGDHAGEAEALRKALAQGPGGSLRVDLLGRLCLAEEALGRTKTALMVCSQLLDEVPDSPLARAALERLGATSR